MGLFFSCFSPHLLILIAQCVAVYFRVNCVTFGPLGGNIYVDRGFFYCVFYPDVLTGVSFIVCSLSFLTYCPGNVLQFVSVCSSVLQLVAVCYTVCQRVAACCSVLQRVAVFCSVLQCFVGYYMLDWPSVGQVSTSPVFCVLCFFPLLPFF